MTDTEVLEYMPAKFNVLIIYKKTSASARHKPTIRGWAVKTMWNTVAPYHGMATTQVVYKNHDCRRISGPSLLEVRCYQHLYGKWPTVLTDERQMIHK